MFFKIKSKIEVNNYGKILTCNKSEIIFKTNNGDKYIIKKSNGAIKCEDCFNEISQYKIINLTDEFEICEECLNIGLINFEEYF